MNRMRLAVLLTAVVAVALGAFAIQAFGSTGRIMIGDQLQITGQTSASGVFSAAGRIHDSGTTKASFSVVSVSDGFVTVVGEEKLTGSKGTITLHFRARSFPANEPRQIAIGTTRITAATWKWAGLKGLTLTDRTVVDFVALRITDIIDSGD
jgi:hypothetical protein